MSQEQSQPTELPILTAEDFGSLDVFFRRKELIVLHQADSAESQFEYQRRIASDELGGLPHNRNVVYWRVKTESGYDLHTEEEINAKFTRVKRVETASMTVCRPFKMIHRKKPIAFIDAHGTRKEYPGGTVLMQYANGEIATMGWAEFQFTCEMWSKDNKPPKNRGPLHRIPQGEIILDQQTLEALSLTKWLARENDR